MKEEIRNHLWLYRIQIMQLERKANEKTISREEAVKGFDENLDLFTERVHASVKERLKPLIEGMQ